MKYYFFILIIYLQSCKTYEIDKEAAAMQMINLKIKKRYSTNIDFSSGKTHGHSSYSNGLKYLIIKNELLHFDTIIPFDIKFFLKSGNYSRWGDPHKIIFKEGYFITFNDTTLKTSVKCKFCLLNIDSIQKIVVRGSRINKLKKTK